LADFRKKWKALARKSKRLYPSGAVFSPASLIAMKNPCPHIVIRDLVISPPLFLAPMAGLTHLALRRVIKETGGVGLLSTEMLASRRLPGENPAISSFLVRTELEKPLSYQMAVAQPDDVDPAMAALQRLGADVVDLNLGCPAPALRQQGAGAALMETPATVRAIVARARKSTDLPLTAKIRLGATLDEVKLRDFCLLLEGEGIDLLTVHARLRGESFSRPPRWDWVGRVKSWLSIPVVANGGIQTAADAARCLAISGADGLMIGRAAAEMPWVFATLATALYGAPPVAEPDLPAVYRRFADLLEAHFQPERRLGRLKEFTHYFQKNYAFGHHLAMTVQSSSSWHEARERAEGFFAKHTSKAVGADR